MKNKDKLNLVTEKKSDEESLKDFLKRALGPVIDKVVDEANAMEKEGHKFSRESIPKLFKRVVPENLLQGLNMKNENEPKKLDDGNSKS